MDHVQVLLGVLQSIHHGMGFDAQRVIALMWIRPPVLGILTAIPFSGYRFSALSITSMRIPTTRNQRIRRNPKPSGIPFCAFRCWRT